MGRDYLADLPEQWRNEPGWQFLAEVLRLSPKFREAYLASGSGGFALDVRPERLAAAVAALRVLPDDAGEEAVARALAPLRTA